MRYYDDLYAVIGNTQIHVDGQSEGSIKDGALVDIVHYLKLRCRGAIAVIGNGGSSAIASHVVTDLVKRGISATAFNDPAVLTCLANDYGYQDVYARQVKAWCTNITMLIAISSSGQSENILNAVEAAKAAGIFTITLSGFTSGNPLRRMGDVNVWTPSSSYGHVELAHQSILHDAVEHLPVVRDPGIAGKQMAEREHPGSPTVVRTRPSGTVKGREFDFPTL